MKHKELETILVANRGEIAARAIRTIKKMGKKAVVVYSTADKDASYLNFADASICIGGAKSAQSYLNIPAIITAAEMVGADGIFPGYGFLSENQEFADICEHHGIKFIGPSSAVMKLMSDKSNAKQVMKEAKVPVVPGSDGALKSVSQAENLANDMGYPVIVKASAGGGGRGMRVVNSKDEMKNAFLSAETEALNAFGDGTLYMEKFILNPRHVEVQVVGDAHGNAIQVGERDCSLQRRHQKVIEESPAIALEEKTRKALLDTAVKATKALKYEGAGTFEFLLDANQNFYFMEMNTRLQVEHPVSEMVSGIDLVELMINVAEGKKLPAQNTINLNGHAIEFRILAEDPNNFMPSPGKITKWVAPCGQDVRLETHVFGGYSVPPHYDSMIAKLIVLGKNREDAIQKSRVALEEYQVQGIKTSIDFHKRMLENEDFLSNNFDTKYLDTLLAKNKN
jgi:acetyl-CoA carboxylase biotin carboxylase subunit